MPLLLTKSKFLAGVNCPRYFWMLFHEPDKIPEADEATQHLFDQGHMVGELAKKLFPEGVELQVGDFQKSLQLANEGVAKRQTLFEAGFVNGSCYARADVLKPVLRDEWELIEVKSSGSLKEEHIYDLAFQKKCYEGVGLKVKKCFLMHINTEYVKDGEIELKKLFVIEDATVQVEQLKEKVDKLVDVLLRIMVSKQKPAKCRNPDGCPLPEECWSDLPDDNVFTLYRGGKKCVELYESGIVLIKDIPDNYKLNDKQKIQKEASKNGKAHIDKKEIKTFISSLKYPIQFLDFETFGAAVPMFDGTKPYQQVPFQFSLHTMEKGGQIQHLSFLAEGSVDPRPAFLKALQGAVKNKGSIVVYNQSFEKMILTSLAEQFPESATWTEGAIARMADLLKPFRAFHYYHPAQNGSASIKNVLPAVTGKGYSELNISNGELASLRFLKITYQPNGEQPSQEEIAQIRKDLTEYCGLDTSGMIDILKKLGEAK